MPIYIDRHYTEGATRHALANAHETQAHPPALAVARKRAAS